MKIPARLVAIAVIAVFAAASASTAEGQDYPLKYKYVTIETVKGPWNPTGPWDLAVINGEFGFYAPRQGRPTDPSAPSIAVVANQVMIDVGFKREGAALRVFFGNLTHKPEIDLTKEQAAKDGWYVTGDYSTNPPRVILTKEPTKYSKWDFVRHVDGATPSYEIKNRNAPGKDAWLSMEDKGVRYKNGDELRKAILTSESDSRFSVEGLYDGR